MRVMIGTAFGISGVFASIIAGYVIQTAGWGMHYGILVPCSWWALSRFES
jgi:hypothetical protein